MLTLFSVLSEEEVLNQKQADVEAMQARIAALQAEVNGGGSGGTGLSSMLGGATSNDQDYHGDFVKEQTLDDLLGPISSVQNTKDSSMDEMQVLNSKEDLASLMRKASRQINIFFHGAYRTQDIEAIQQREEAERNQSWHLFTIEQLVQNLKKKDAVIVERVLAVLCERADETTDLKMKENAANEIRNTGGLKTLISIIQKPPAPSHRLPALRVVTAISTNDENKDTLCRMGGIKPVLGLVQSEKGNTEILLRVITFIYNISNIERAQDAINRVSGIPMLIPLLANSMPTIQMIALKALINLCELTRNQDAIARAGVLQHVLKQIASDNQMLRTSALRLLGKLAHTEPIQNQIQLTQGIPLLLKFLNVYDVYNNRPNVKFTDNLGPKHGPLEDQQLLVVPILSTLGQKEHNRKVVGIQGVKLLMVYLKVNGQIPPEVFKWNTDVTLEVLKALLSLTLNRENRIAFFEAQGPTLILRMLTVEALPKSMILAAASIMSQLSTTEEFSNQIGGDTITYLVKILQQYSDNEVLQLIVVKTFLGLAPDDNNKQKIFEEGGIQLLNKLLSSDNQEIAIAVCQVSCPSRFLSSCVLSFSPFSFSFISLSFLTSLSKLPPPNPTNSPNQLTAPRPSPPSRPTSSSAK